MQLVIIFFLSQFIRKRTGFSKSGVCVVAVSIVNREVRHPRCVGSITKNFVYYTYSGTQLYFTQQYSRNTTTCFGPIGGPSSGCDLTYKAAIKYVWVFLGGMGLGKEISLFQ